jgi:ubiquitin carboxyl-terminal hydrolase 4/11/15
MRILAGFGLEEGTEAKLIDYFQNRMIGVLDDREQLTRYNILDDQVIALDTKDGNGDWRFQKRVVRGISSSRGSRSHGVWMKPGVCGLQNLGNTCFFNSAVQCLVHTVPLVRHFLSPSWRDEINVNNKLGTRGVLAEAFADLVGQFYGGSCGVIDPSDLKFQIGRFAPRFAGWEQHDSHELLVFLLDALHEDLNRCRRLPGELPPVLEDVVGDSTNDSTVAPIAWRHHLLRNNSAIVDSFSGQLRSTLICPVCHRVSVVFDPYSSLTLPLQQRVRASSSVFVPRDSAAPVRAARGSSSSFRVVQGVRRHREQSISWEGEGTSFQFAIANGGFWVPCSVVISSAESFGPVLVMVANENVSLTEIAEAAEREMSWMWKKRLCDRGSATEDIETTSPASEFVEPRFRAQFMGSWGRLHSDPTHRDLSLVNVVLYVKEVFAKEFKRDLVLEKAISRRTAIAAIVGTRGTGIQLVDCLEMHSLGEILDEDNQWFCPHCRKHVCAEKKLDIWSVPEVLIIQLKRFNRQGYFVSKLTSDVEFPDLLDMAPHVVGNTNKPLQYRLYAVSEHSGSLAGGHYTAHALVRPIEGGAGEWYSFNDSSASPASATSAHSPLAYVLFYERLFG